MAKEEQKIDIRDDFDEDLTEEFVDDIFEETEAEKELNETESVQGINTDNSDFEEDDIKDGDLITEEKIDQVEELNPPEEQNRIVNNSEDLDLVDDKLPGHVDESLDELDRSKSVEAIIAEKSDNLSDRYKPTPEIDAAVDDIVRNESDEMIAEQDSKIEAFNISRNKKTFKQRIKNFFGAWWENKAARYGALSGVFILFAIISLLPTTRYTVLNIFGVRVSTSMSVIDSQTRLPLKNINITIQDRTSKTDELGKVSFDKLKLGKSKLYINKRGYGDSVREIVLGWGSNPIGEQEIVATGTQIIFVLKDWQSKKPVTKARAEVGESSAIADENGKITLTIGEDNLVDEAVKVSADGYRDENLTNESLIDTQIELLMVPYRKHIFVSNRSGKYDVYKIDLDKKNEEILLASTGKEREAPIVMEHSTKNITALVSSRDGETNGDGYILDGIYIINADNNEIKRIARSEQLQIIGWSGDNLIFWQVVEGTSRANPERSKLFSYNELTSEKIELASANYFNDVKMVGEKIYYAVSSFAVPQSQAKLYSVRIDGKDNKKLLDSQVWSIYRSGYNRLVFSAENQKWYEKIADLELKEIGPQQSPESIDFKASMDGDRAAYVEIRDGKGVLLISNTESTEEAQIISMPGLSQVLYWVNDRSLVFRIVTNYETADYFIDLENKEPLKISDVTATKNVYF